MTEQITFDSFDLHKSILVALKKKGFEKPSEIQEKILPVALKNEHDIIGVAQTGTGKTAAFGIPIINLMLDESRKRKVPRAIILAPTRELAIQVAKELEFYKGSLKLEVLPVYGGQAINTQINKLNRGVDIVVGTPGRVLDLIDRKVLDLSKVNHFVLDEADEMLKMGFIDDVEKILAESKNKEKRIFLFSATMPDRIKNLSKKYMKKQVIVEVKKKQDNIKLISQFYCVVKRTEKFDTLKKIIDSSEFFYGIVFCKTKADVEEVTKTLKRQKYEADCIHGDIIQSKRERILNRFKKMEISILVATDVAARGIDVDSLSHVINHSMPKEVETYVHRIGRTGRAGKEGTAVSFLSPKEKFLIKQIEKETKGELKPFSLPSNKEIVKQQETRFYDDLEKSIDKKDSSYYLAKADELIAKYGDSKVVSGLLQELNILKNNKSDFEYKQSKFSNGRDDKRGGSDNRRGRDDSRDSKKGKKYNKDQFMSKGQLRLFVAKGKMDRFGKRELAEFLEKKSGISNVQMDNVKIREKFSFVTVDERDAKKIVKSYTTKKGRPLVEIANE